MWVNIRTAATKDWKISAQCCFEYEMDKIWMFSLVCKCATWHLDLSDVAPCKYGEEHPVEATGAHYRSEQTSGGFTSPSLGLLHGYKAAQTDARELLFHFEAHTAPFERKPLLLSDLTISFVICLSVIWTDTDENEHFYFIQILFFCCFHLSYFPVYFKWRFCLTFSK